ncbi:MAG: preprotein translocase subunit SecE [gamma proteobacterium endosymbiont of Trioza apicalis]
MFLYNINLIIKLYYEIYNELVSITWLTYKETLYITLIVILFILIISFILWSIDSILLFLISFFYNLRF